MGLVQKQGNGQHACGHRSAERKRAQRRHDCDQDSGRPQIAPVKHEGFLESGGAQLGDEKNPGVEHSEPGDARPAGTPQEQEPERAESDESRDFQDDPARRPRLEKINPDIDRHRPRIGPEPQCKVLEEQACLSDCAHRPGEIRHCVPEDALELIGDGTEIRLVRPADQPTAEQCHKNRRGRTGRQVDRGMAN